MKHWSSLTQVLLHIENIVNKQKVNNWLKISSLCIVDTKANAIQIVRDSRGRGEKV